MLDNLKGVLNDVKLWVLASLTLGLAPFVPEPHIWGKLKWVLGGTAGMQMMDYLDLMYHGLPFIFLIRALIVKKLKKI